MSKGDPDKEKGYKNGDGSEQYIKGEWCFSTSVYLQLIMMLLKKLARRQNAGLVSLD